MTTPVLSPHDYPAGTVAIPAGEFTRFGGFLHSMATLAVPPGTHIKLMQSLDIVHNLNTIIREIEGDWLWFQADDHIFPSDTLTRLLHRDVDVVVPIVVRRSPPFVPVIFKDVTDDGYAPFEWRDLPATGLVECYAAGTGGMLVRRHVLDAIGDPWFSYENGETLNEDLVFSRRIRDAGFAIHADVEVTMGHRGMMTVWPVLEDGEWAAALDLGASAGGRRTTALIREHEGVLT